MGKAERPEHTAPPEYFYNDAEARKYTTSSRIVTIQERLTERALELLALPNDGRPRLLLDLGCGSGLSGETLTEAGHEWVGMDISPSMLAVALDRDSEGDLLLGDMGQGLPVRTGVFDGAISISAVQWLCNAERAGDDPRLRLRRFFRALYGSLARGARAVLQMYPENTAQAEMIVHAAMRVGFGGGLVVDYPNSTRAKKYFCVLTAGQPAALPAAREGDGEQEMEDADGGGDGEGTLEDGGSRKRQAGVQMAKRERPAKRNRAGIAKPEFNGGSKRHPDQKGGRGWILDKKEARRNKGYTDVKPDSKYTGRKRPKKF